MLVIAAVIIWTYIETGEIVSRNSAAGFLTLAYFVSVAVPVGFYLFTRKISIAYVGEDKCITVYYNHETEEFTDDYQAEEIKESLLYFVLNKELDSIEEINDCYGYYSYKHSEVIYPQGEDGYYDLKQYQPEYAYQYLREHEVSVRLMDEKINVVCAPDETDEILKRLDVIFKELFRGGSTSAVIRFYRSEDREAIEEDAEEFMYVYYRDGDRKTIYLQGE